mmetsp:Transcript_42/g.125  ORF Transcript_42/g.125 Transcript_42/m.125 type:complete len:207 (+) Transcript_42:757-1377(+)
MARRRDGPLAGPQEFHPTVMAGFDEVVDPFPARTVPGFRVFHDRPCHPAEHCVEGPEQIVQCLDHVGALQLSHVALAHLDRARQVGDDRKQRMRVILHVHERQHRERHRHMPPEQVDLQQARDPQRPVAEDQRSRCIDVRPDHIALIKQPRVPSCYRVQLTGSLRQESRLGVDWAQNQVPLRQQSPPQRLQRLGGAQPHLGRRVQW